MATAREQLITVRQILSDTYGFIRGQEANRAISSLSMAQLIQDQMNRNGNDELVSRNRYNPYLQAADVAASSQPASLPPSPVNPSFYGSTPSGSASKLEELEALNASITKAIEFMKSTDPISTGLAVAEDTELDDMMSEIAGMTLQLELVGGSGSELTLGTPSLSFGSI